LTSHEHTVQRYSLLHPLFMAFFSKSLYQDVGRNWKGPGLVFLFSAIALCTIPFVLLVQSELSDLLNEQAPKIVRQMPAIKISKGKVSIDKPEPYYVKDEKSGYPLIIFDTTGEVRSLTGSKAIMLVSQTAVTIRNNDGQTRTIDLSGIDGFSLDRRLLYEWTEELSKSLVFILYPLAVFFSFLLHLIEIAILAAIASFLTKSPGPLLSYRTYMRLAAVSMTPAMVLGAVFNIAGSALPFWWLTSIPLTAGYLLFAVRVNMIMD
jgi:hypothetical protein